MKKLLFLLVFVVLLAGCTESPEVQVTENLSAESQTPELPPFDPSVLSHSTLSLSGYENWSATYAPEKNGWQHKYSVRKIGSNYYYEKFGFMISVFSTRDAAESYYDFISGQKTKSGGGEEVRERTSPEIGTKSYECNRVEPPVITGGFARNAVYHPQIGFLKGNFVFHSTSAKAPDKKTLAWQKELFRDVAGMVSSKL